MQINDVIAGMADLIEQSVGRQVKIRFDLAEGLCPVLTEAHQLELAILNLCINARDAMHEGGELEISTRSVQGAGTPALGSGPHVHLTISDNGTGMSPEVASKALDPFFTTKDVGKGTGLGLSMAFGFARQSGGVLYLETSLGGGTIVHIYLPCSDEAAIDTPNRLGSVPPGLLRASADHGIVVLVDDDDDVRLIMSDMLEDQGYTVRSFARPADVLSNLAVEEAAVIIVDFMMPEMNGADLAAEIRRRVPGQRIVFVSGYSDTATLDTLSGPNSRVLRKPFTSADLAEALAALQGT